ncbi:hypothetical protein DSO57_1021295 [Entomophthora muscae]|uniref:Uncharacterized protein n=1 Tax=Entomophthora muscae TaxID=34485 RepID=A0ACC2TQM7_9FUNG|nr:hypothetical protein DSO57_1021295 [Entomophthora muscae]
MSGQPPPRGSRRGSSLGYSSPRGNSGYVRGAYMGRGRGRSDPGTGYYRGRGGYAHRANHPNNLNHNGEPHPSSRGGYKGRGGYMRSHDNSFNSRGPSDYHSMNHAANYGDPRNMHHSPYHHPHFPVRGLFDPPLLNEALVGSPTGLQAGYTIALALQQEMEKHIQLASKTTGYYIGIPSKYGNQVIPSIPREL